MVGQDGSELIIFLAGGLVWLLIVALLIGSGFEVGPCPKRRPVKTDESKASDRRFAARLRNPRLLMAYLFWKAVQTGDKPPRLVEFRWCRRKISADSFTVSVERQNADDLDFRYTEVGSALEARLGRQIGSLHAAEVGGGESFASLESAYRRCARTLAPSYEYANYDFGDDSAFAFERLLLPFVDTSGRIEHLVGIVLFENQPKSP